MTSGISIVVDVLLSGPRPLNAGVLNAGGLVGVMLIPSSTIPSLSFHS